MRRASLPLPRSFTLRTLRVPLSWVVLAVSLTATALVWYACRELQRQSMQTEFTLRTDQTIADISRQLHAYEQILHTGAAFFAANRTVTRKMWRDFIARLELEQRFPGMQGMGFIKAITDAERAAYIAAVRGEGLPGYDIQPAGKRDAYMAILYFEPLAGRNLQAFGFDAFSEPMRRATLERARDTGTVALSRKVNLFPEGEATVQSGVLMYLPLYRDGLQPQTVDERRQKLIGYIYIPLLMDDVLRNAVDSDMHAMDIRIFDQSTFASKSLLYANNDRAMRDPVAPAETGDSVRKAVPMQVNGQPWTILFDAPPALFSTHYARTPDLMAGAGLIVSFLLFMIALASARAREHALQLANTRASELHQTEAQLAGIVHLTSEGIILVDKKQKIILFNPAAEKIFQCTTADAIGSSLSRFIPQQFRGAHRLPVETLGKTPISAYQINRQHKRFGLRADGKAFLLEASISMATERGQSLYTVMLRDVSQHDLAEEMQRAKQVQLERLQAVAGFGSYQINLSLDGLQQTHHWSPEIYKILGHDPRQDPVSPTEYIDRFVHPEDQARLHAIHTQILFAGDKTGNEYRIVRPDGTLRYVYDQMECMSSGPEGKTFLGIVHDITERKQEEIKRLKSAAKFQAFFEQLPGISYIASLGRQGSMRYVSPKIEKLLGFTPDQWCSNPQLRIRQLHPEDRERVLQTIAQAVSAGHTFNIDYRIFTRDGEPRWLHDQARVIANVEGDPLLLQGTLLDITERKQAQAELEHSHRGLQKMITALDSLRTEEQKRLAQEMHDDLGQLLAAMKMDLSTLQQRLPQGDSKLFQQLGSLHELVDAMVTSVRRIIADLPPKVLDEVGLFKALEFLTENFEKRHQILCQLTLPLPQPVLEERLATPIYRIVQEALNNVAKHAHATHVEVQIECSADRLALRVTDDGQGMAPNQLGKTGSFGLIGMRERVIALGGEMQLDSTNGAGTTLHISIPHAPFRNNQIASSPSTSNGM